MTETKPDRPMARILLLLLLALVGTTLNGCFPLVNPYAGGNDPTAALVTSRLRETARRNQEQLSDLEERLAELNEADESDEGVGEDEDGDDGEEGAPTEEDDVDRDRDERAERSQLRKARARGALEIESRLSLHYGKLLASLGARRLKEKRRSEADPEMRKLLASLYRETRDRFEAVGTRRRALKRVVRGYRRGSNPEAEAEGREARSRERREEIAEVIDSQEAELEGESHERRIEVLEWFVERLRKIENRIQDAGRA